MPALPARRGFDTTDPLIIRTLRREYRIHLPDDASREACRFVEIKPEIEGFELEPFDIVVERKGGFLRCRLPHGALLEGAASRLISHLHVMMHWDNRQSHGAYPMMHGATMIIGGRRLLIVGGKTNGKTTLSLYLTLRGHRFEGDEHLILLPQGVIARPRTLRVKQGSFPLVGLSPDDFPSVTAWYGETLHAISPVALGQDWIIRQGRLDGVVFLAANHGGRSVLGRIGVDEAFAGLMAQCYFTGRSPAAEAARLRVLAATTPAYSLRVGSLPEAETHLVNSHRLD
ncbi:MAG: hypothetical protein ABL879_11115 [Devosia sp.]